MKRTPVEKKPIDPQRIRCLPREGFSWIDRRFVREGFLEDLPRDAILLYFFLVAVSDSEGLSFYADPTVQRLLKLDAQELTHARFWLQKAALVLYAYPLYQVLSLPSQRVAPKKPTASSTSTSAHATSRNGDAISFQEFFALLQRDRLNGEHRRGGEA